MNSEEIEDIVKDLIWYSVHSSSLNCMCNPVYNSIVESLVESANIFVGRSVGVPVTSSIGDSVAISIWDYLKTKIK